jgi:hypothetical protein
MEAGKDFLNKSGRLSHDLCLQDLNFTLLVLVGIKEFWSNMLREITLHIAHMHLCNTSDIIFIHNGGGVDNTFTT